MIERNWRNFGQLRRGLTQTKLGDFLVKLSVEYENMRINSMLMGRTRVGQIICFIMNMVIVLLWK